MSACSFDIVFILKSQQHKKRQNEKRDTYKQYKTRKSREA